MIYNKDVKEVFTMKDNILNFLKEYPHSIPIIYSHIELQYESKVVFDELDGFGILFTTFDYHYAFGKVPKDTQSFIDYLRDYVKENKKEELILFGPNEEWNKFLYKVMKEIRGTVDKRCLYLLNKEKFEVYDAQNKFVKLEFVDDENSHIKFPQSNIYINGNIVSYCRAFMMGKGHAELDVWTDERYRKRGLAFDGCLNLIGYLVDQGIIPNWTCWEAKESSRELAKKLGFELVMVYDAFVWVSEFGEF